MAGNIAKMSVEAVQAAITEFDSREHEFNDAVNAIGNTMFNLEGTWTGEAEQAFENRLRELMNNVKTIINSMEGAKAKLQLAISSYEETEATQTSAINAVNEGESDYVV